MILTVTWAIEASSQSGACARTKRRTKLCDQGVEAGGDPAGVGAGRAVHLPGDPVQRRFQPQGRFGRIFVLSQRALRAALCFNQPTG